jgi:hypothetical protein
VSKKSDGGPAFPYFQPGNQAGFHQGKNKGMSLLDWFAGNIAGGMVGNIELLDALIRKHSGDLSLVGDDLVGTTYLFAAQMVKASQEIKTDIE